MKKLYYFLCMSLLLLALVGCNILGPTQYKLTMQQPVGQGTVVPEPGVYNFVNGAEVVLSANASNGWQFVKWEVNGSEYSSDAETQLKMNEAKTARAFFEEIPLEVYTLTMLEPEGSGTVVPAVGNHAYEEGTSVNIEAIPDEGWEFIRWEVDGIEHSTLPETTLTMDQSKTVKAFFEEIPLEVYTLTMLEPEGNGTVVPAVGNHAYEEGTSVNIEAIPDEGWEFLKWELNSLEYSVESQTAVVVNEDIVLKAYFETMEFGEIGVPYNAADGLTITLNSIEIVEKTGSYQYIINYKLENNTDHSIDEGQFKLYYKEESGGLPQYGFFGTLFPGDTMTRSYVFEEEKHILFRILAYHHDQFFEDSPPADSLMWEIKY